MENNSLYKHSTPYQVLHTIGISLIILGIVILGQTLGSALGVLFYTSKGLSLEEIASKIASPTDKTLILLLQGLVQVFTFFILPFIYIYNFKRELPSKFGISTNFVGVPLILMILILLILVPIINLTAEWNKNINFPDIWGIEDKVVAMEESAKKLTELIVTISGTGDFIFTLIIVSIIPAIGEELLFRGIAQNQLRSVLNNPHLAIWIAAFLFSFVHFQFFGFIPRMLLGVIFGYLYFWSGNLLVPIIMHFFNNSLALISMHLYKEKTLEVDPEAVDIFPVWAFILSLVLLAYLLSAFKKYSQKDHESEINS